VANADVPEVEPNDDIAGANPISCGDDFRPAAIDPADDFDTLVMTANAGDLITFGTNADGAGDVEDTIIGIFDDLGNLIDSDDDSGPGFYSLLSDIPAPYTGTYYLAVIGFDATLTGNYQAFVRCTAAPTPPSNDTCLGAIKLDCKDFTVAGTTAGAFNDYTPTLTPPTGCTGFTANGADVVYLVTLPDGGSIDLVYTSSADASVYLVNDCVSPSDAACVAGADLTFGRPAGDAELREHVGLRPDALPDPGQLRHGQLRHLHADGPALLPAGAGPGHDVGLDQGDLQAVDFRQSRNLEVSWSGGAFGSPRFAGGECWGGDLPGRAGRGARGPLPQPIRRRCSSVPPLQEVRAVGIAHAPERRTIPVETDPARVGRAGIGSMRRATAW
jgi:hypothetical protein